jgi:hypothetical protein
MWKRLVAAAALSAVFIEPSLAQTDTHDGLRPDGQQRRLVEVAFVLDTTGSMGPLIEGAKRTIWSIATSILDKNLDAEVRMALVAYRDIGDEYVTRRFELTRDIQTLYGHLLGFQARGGGDWPESVNEALDVAVTRIAWTSGAHVDRIIFLVGDAPPHMDYPQDRKYPEVVAAARRRGIIVNAVQAGAARDTERVWREIAQRGEGRYLRIPQDGGQMSRVETPFDDEIIRIQIEINGTVVPYGTRAQRESVEQRQSQIAAAPRSSASDMATYVNRASRGRDAITGEGDLVSDVLRNGRDLAAIPPVELPESMRAMSLAERRAHLDAQDRRRQELAARMLDLTRQRDTFIAGARLATRPGNVAFDSAVSETLGAQIRR